MITANKDIKAVDLVREALEKAKEFEEYHCFISMNEARALEHAREIDERIASVTKELEAEKALRAEKVKQVADPKFVLYYERLRTKRWPVVVALTHDGVCDGCHLVQPPSVGQLADANAKNGEMGKPQSIVACTMCGRVLYRA